MILALVACTLAGVAVGAVTVTAWAVHHAPRMDDEPSQLNLLDGIMNGDDSRDSS